jgi:pyruvate formate lyase activating enzyme
MMKGLIFSIKRYSVHDGPGIRVTLFMKGCPLSCRWCHNPEGISPDIESLLETKKVGEKEFSHPAQVGKYYSIEEILVILDKEKIFFQQSGGGVTFSGGEPMIQLEFLREALKTFHAIGIHTAVDTSGYCPEAGFREIMPYTDLFLFDIKHLSEKKHLEYTGVSNRLILKNFRMLLESGKELMVRFPVIPGINDDPDHLKELKKFLIESKSGNIKKLNLLPFHRIGVSKYRKLGLVYQMRDIDPPSSARMKELKDFFSETGLKVKIGG